MPDTQPWLSSADWTPPSIRQMGNDDYTQVERLRAWTHGKPLTPGLPLIYEVGVEQSGYLRITYDDGSKYGGYSSWTAHMRQHITGREGGVCNYSSLLSAIGDLIEMALSYEADDVLFAAMPGIA